MKRSLPLPSVLAWTSGLLFALTPFARLSANTDTDGDGIPDQLETSPFHVIPGEFSYQDAKDDAQRRGGRLASFTDSTELDGAKASMVIWSEDVPEGKPLRDVPYPIWIGLEKDGTWVWSDGSPGGLLETNWAAGEPSVNVSRTRGGMDSNQQWQAFNPAQSSGYLLELPITNPNSKDSDGDGASDYTELFILHTDPNVANYGLTPPLSFVDFADPMVNGAYEGLLVDLNHGPTTALTLNVTSKGGFSGAMYRASGKISIKGTFASNGTATVAVKNGGLISYLQLVIAPDSVTGIYRVGASLSASPDGSSPTLVGELRRSIYSKSLPNPRAGSYTIIIPASSTPKTGQPGGDGYLVGTLKSDGIATFTGLTSDGQALKWSGNLLEGDMLSFFSSFAKGTGFANGNLTLRDTADIDSSSGLVAMADLDGEIFINRAYSAGSSASYAFSSNAYGSLYRNAPYSMLPSFADFTTDADNSILIFAGGPYSGQEAVTTWATNNRLSLPATQTRSLSGGINSKNGELTANYRYNDPATIDYASTSSKLKGVILQKSGEVRGNYNMGAGSSGRIQLQSNDGGLVAPVNIISPKSKTIGPQGGSYKIYITSSELWDAVVSYDYSPYSDSADWLSLSVNSGTGDAVITVEVAENENYYPRSGKIKIAGITHTINQKQAIYDPNTDDNGSGGGGGGGGSGSRVVIDPVSRVINTFSNSYPVIVTGYDPNDSSNPAADFFSPVSWASVIYTPGAPLADGTPQGVATVFVEFNPFYFTRTALLTIGGVRHTLTQLP